MQYERQVGSRPLGLRLLGRDPAPKRVSARLERVRADSEGGLVLLAQECLQLVGDPDQIPVGVEELSRQTRAVKLGSDLLQLSHRSSA